MIIDVDKFKAVNGTHGHQVGDQVLQHVAVVLDRAVRESDFVGRWGGEEFMVLCPNTSATDAGRVAEKTLRALRLRRGTLARCASVTATAQTSR